MDQNNHSQLIFSEDSDFLPACVFSAKGKITFTNQAFTALTGTTTDQLLGKSFLTIIPEKYYRLLDTQMRKLSTETPSIVVECYLAPSNQAQKYIQFNFHARFDTNGKMIDIHVIAHDQSRFKTVEKRMRHLIETEYVISAISSSFINIRPEGIHKEIESALNLIGEFIEVDRCSVLSIDQPELLTVSVEWCADSIRSLKQQRGQLNLNAFPWIKNSLERLQIIKLTRTTHAEIADVKQWLSSENMQSILIIPMNSHGKLSGCVIFEAVSAEKDWAKEHITRLRTISEIFVTAQARLKAEKEIEEHQKLLVQADRLSSLGTLVAGVAHEINNPTSMITMSTPILKEAWNDILPILDNYYKANGDFTIAGLEYSETREDIQELCNGIIDGGERIKNIVLDLKNYSRNQENNQFSDIDINQIIGQALSLTHTTVKEFTHHMNTSLSNHLPHIQGNKQRLQQVLINLIVNAAQSLRSTDESITISTSYDAEHNQVVVMIKDQGCGIAADDMDKIFDPFFTRKGDLGGTGLGLSISHTIISEHSGSLQFSSEENKGTTATITLPATIPE